MKDFFVHNKQERCICIDSGVDIRPNITPFEQKFRKVLLLILLPIRRNDLVCIETLSIEWTVNQAKTSPALCHIQKSKQ